MKRFAWLVGFCALALCGCGPMQMPMPVRLDDENQKQIDEAWNKALTPIDHFDHQAMLDAFLISHAYQVGVDKLSFHSEKMTATGLVVMEIHFDRSLPAEDRFEVRIYDAALKLLRLEAYSRQEIEREYRELFVDCTTLEQAERDGSATPEQSKRLAALKARMEAVEAVFPKDEPKKEDRKVKAVNNRA
ncbi:MAG TPA: hypothetical protein VMS17_31120 [Gemmataceae bacterium]|nr:hypothetical protein [Gemmataceae bacterium]